MGCEEAEEMNERVTEKRNWKVMKGRKDHNGVLGRKEKEKMKMRVEGMDCHIK